MIAELSWPVRIGRALSDRQVAVNVQAQTLTQRLMTVTQRAAQSEAVMRQLKAERSAIFASVEDRCLEKLESILEEYSACLTYAPTRWALMRELDQKDAVTGQSSVGRDRAQPGLPLRTEKTVTWASVLEQAFDDGALVEGAGSGEHCHLVGLGLGRV